jgi:hypothetical protein
MKHIVAMACLFLLGSRPPSAAAEMPFVYDKENTGVDIKTPTLPAFDALVSIPYLPDPFLMADGKRMGASYNYRATERQLTLLRDMGCNAIRTSHNPPPNCWTSPTSWASW